MSTSIPFYGVPDLAEVLGKTKHHKLLSLWKRVHFADQICLRKATDRALFVEEVASVTHHLHKVVSRND